MNSDPRYWRAVIPGLFLSATIAIAVNFVSLHLGGAAMLYALLFGMAFNFLSDSERMKPGIRFASGAVLRAGVALLGLRITIGDVVDLGLPVVSLVVAGVATTILAGWAIGRLCGLGNGHSLLSAGAVAICGASATLAIASVLPPGRDRERNMILTVASVTALSTLAMVIYPVAVSYLGFDNRLAGVFLGATIHDVAQVVGAGYIVSDETGEISTLVKLMRVACLVPVVLGISMVTANRGKIAGARQPLMPWFVVAFVFFVFINSAGLVPDIFRFALTVLSSWCLLTAVAALGVRTSLESLVKVGPAPIIAMMLQTVFLAGFVLVGLIYLV